MAILNKPAFMRAFIYLKTPNFKYHPLNYFFIIAFFFAGFFPVNAFAVDPDRFFQYGGSGSTSIPETVAKMEARDGYTTCSLTLDAGTRLEYWCRKAAGGGSMTYAPAAYCPTYQPYFIGPTSQCTSTAPPPPPPACVKDEYKLISYKTVTTSSGADTGGITITPKPTAFGDCVYTTSGIALNPDFPDPQNNDSSVQCYAETEGSTDVTCYYTTWMQNTGNAPAPDSEVTEAENLPEQTPIKDGNHTEKEVTETVNQESITEVMPDGTVVKQDVTTTTTTKGKGTSVETTTEEKKIVRDNGITKSQTTVTTTTTNPDGSKSVVSETTTAYEQTDKELIVVKNEDGSLSVVNNPGYEGSSKSKTTKRYDADGNLISETEEKEKSGDDEKTTPKACEDNPQAIGCEAITAKTGKDGEAKSFYTSAYPDGMAGVMAGLTDGVAESMEDSGFSDVGISRSSSSPRWTFRVRISPQMDYGTHTIQLASYIWQFIALCFMITTLWLCRSLIFGG